MYLFIETEPGQIYFKSGTDVNENNWKQNRNVWTDSVEYTYPHTHTHVHTQTHTHMHTYIRIYMCVCVCVCVYLQK